MNVKTVHISIDDVSHALMCLSYDKKVKNLTDVELFRYLCKLHQLFDASFTLYLYGEDGGFNLSDVPSTYISEFESWSDWLKFGYHAPSPQRQLTFDPEYVQKILWFNKEVMRFAGAKSLVLLQFSW